MKAKLLNIALILSSLLGYLEWGGDNHAFLIETEIEIISKLFSDPMSVLHPFILLPLFGQVLLIGTLFQKSPGRWLTYAGIIGIGILLLIIFLIGLMNLSVKVILSALPFLVLCVITVRHHRSNVTKSTG